MVGRPGSPCRSTRSSARGSRCHGRPRSPAARTRDRCRRSCSIRTRPRPDHATRGRQSRAGAPAGRVGTAGRRVRAGQRLLVPVRAAPIAGHLDAGVLPGQDDPGGAELRGEPFRGAQQRALHTGCLRRHHQRLDPDHRFGRRPGGGVPAAHRMQHAVADGGAVPLGYEGRGSGGHAGSRPWRGQLGQGRIVGCRRSHREHAAKLRCARRAARCARRRHRVR